MTREEQRYEIRQILAEGRHKGFHNLMTMIAVARFFDKHGIIRPNNLSEWLGLDISEDHLYHWTRLQLYTFN